MAERSSLKPPAASAASLIPQGLQAGKSALPLGRPFTLIGARNRAHLHLLSSGISRNHACIIATDNGLYLRDLASRSGVTVNGRQVKEVELRDGDLVGIGSFKFKFTDPAGPVRFPMTPKASPAMLEIDGTTLTPLDIRSLLIGRRPNCDVPLTEPAASNSHALIFESNGQRFIRDLGSRTGTLVNGKPIHHQLLEFGDQIHIGQTEFRYLAESQESADAGIALEEDHELEPIGLHFADEPPASAAESDGEFEQTDQPIASSGDSPIALAADAPLALTGDEPIPLVHEDQPPHTQIAAEDDAEPIPSEPPLPEVEQDNLEPSVHELTGHIADLEDMPASVTPTDRAVEPLEYSEFVSQPPEPASEFDHEPPIAEPLPQSEREPAPDVDPERVPDADPEPSPYIEAEPTEASAFEEAPPPEAAAGRAPLAETTEASAVEEEAPPPPVETDVAAPVELEEPRAPEPASELPAENQATAEVSEPTPRPLLEDVPPPAPVQAPSSDISTAARPPRAPRKKSSSSRRSSRKREPERSIGAPEPAILTASIADVIETTEPTPESALDLEPALESVQTTQAPAAPIADDVSAPERALSDTAFGQVVQEFAGPELGPLVEQSSLQEAAHDTSPRDAERPEEPAMSTNRTLPPEPAAPEPAFAEPAAPEPAWPAPSVEDVFSHSAAAFPEPTSSEPALPEPSVTSPDLAQLAQEETAPLSSAGQTSAVSQMPAEEDFGLHFTAADVLAEPHGPAVATEPPPPPTILQELHDAPPPPPAATDPFFGMTRDLGSFIGGMPLPPPKAPEPQSDEPTLSFSDEPDALPPLDESLLADPEPLELFDGTAEKLDALPERLGPIDDLSGALADAPPAQAPKRSPPAPPRANPRGATPPMAGSKTAGPSSRRPVLDTLTGHVGAMPQDAFSGGNTPGRQAPPRPTVRTTDVFSQTAFPGAADPVFGGVSGEIPAIPPVSRKQPEPALGRTRREPIPPNRQPGTRRPPAPTLPAALQTTTPAPAAQAPPPQPPPAEAPAPRPWYRRFGVLLSMMIAAIIIVIVIVLLLPQSHLLQGTLQIKGLDNMDVFARREQVRNLRQMLDGPEVRNIAEGNLASQNVSYGFVQDPVAMDALADPRNSPFDETRGVLLLSHATTDPVADTPRMKAILAALYARSQSENDRAASARGRLDQAQAALHELETRDAALETQAAKASDQIAADGGAAAQSLLQAPDAGLLVLQQKDLQLHQSLNAASELVTGKREALEQAQASAARLDSAGAAQARQIRQSIAKLSAQLDAVRLARSGKTDQAARAFETAMDRFDHLLAAMPQESSDAGLAAFVPRVRDLSDQIRQLDSRLSIRQHDDADAVAQLRRQLADRREAHLREVWNSDGKLQEMLEERSAQAHRYSTAADSGYANEAARIKGILDDLDRKIDARRSALGTGGQSADDLQHRLQQTIDRMEQGRQTDEQQIARKLAALSAAIPDPSALPSGWRQAVAQLAGQARLMSAARDTYATAVALTAADADAQARRLQARLADEQARLDSLGGQAKPAALAAVRNELAQAQRQADAATTAYMANHTLLAALRELADVKARQSELADALHNARDQAASRKAQADQIAVIQPPDGNSIAIVYGKDQRLAYLASGLLAMVALFAVPLWMSVNEPRRRVPMAFAVAEDFDVSGRRAPGFQLPAEFDPNEHPAAV